MSMFFMKLNGTEIALCTAMVSNGSALVSIKHAQRIWQIMPVLSRIAEYYGMILVKVIVV